MTFLSAVVVLSPKNVWAYGSSGTIADDVFHWNGSKWQRYLSDTLNFIPQGISASGPDNVWVSGYAFSHVHWDGQQWHSVTVPYWANAIDVVPDGKGGYWFGAQAILTRGTWTPEQVPGFTGGFGDVTRIPGTTSFLLDAGVQTGSPATQKPTIFRFDL